jgi:hypothetical protein
MIGNFGWQLWPATLAGNFGRQLWPATLAGNFGRQLQPATSAGNFGWQLWLATLASNFGWHSWLAFLASNFGLQLWPATLAGSFGWQLVCNRYGSEDPDPHPDPYENVTVIYSGFQIRTHRIHMFLGLLDTDLDPSIKNNKKNIISTDL